MLVIYSLVAHDWNILFFLGLVGVIIVYSVLLRRFTEIKLHSIQPCLFLIGIILVYLSMGSPLSTMSHLSFSTHMIFMSIHYFIIPPLLLIGTPYSLFLQIENHPWRRFTEKLFIPPSFALYIFALL
ncbi:cytochrome c oxidase assembly protein, partial [Microvirga sp. 3-52]|nr:cytochrome c oxidase assembly protein [Microvirga sp. 3-52]